VTCHWVDRDFELNDSLLDFKKLSGQHTGVNLANELLGILEEYGIAKKLFCITTDAASNNDTMVRELEELLINKGIDWDAGKMHINCLNHIINLAVQEFLKSIKVVKSEDDAEGEEQGEDDDEVIEMDQTGDYTFANTLAKVRGISKVLSPVT
jgi:hypothetical protein